MSSDAAQLNWWKPVGLAVLFLGLGSAAWYLEVVKRPHDERLAENQKKIFDIAESTIKSLEIVDGPFHFRFECQAVQALKCRPRDHSAWKMTHPILVDADASNVNSFLSSLSHLTAMQLLSLKDQAPEKHAQIIRDFGLSPTSRSRPEFPRIKIDVHNRGTITAYFGATHTIGSRIYLGRAINGKFDTENFFLVPGNLREQLSRSRTYWRGKSIFSEKLSGITKISFNGRRDQFELTPKKNFWRMKFKKEEPADRDRVEKFISAIEFLKAKDFLSEEIDSPGAQKILDQSNRLVTATIYYGGRSSPLIIKLFKQKLKDQKRTLLAINTRSELFEVSATIERQLGLTPHDLKLRNLITSVERFSISKIEAQFSPSSTPSNFKNNPPTRVAIKDGQNWVNPPNSQTGLATIANDLLAKLADQSIKSIGSAQPSTKILKLTLHQSENLKDPIHLEFWKKDEQTWARLSQNPYPESYLIAKPLADALPWSKGKEIQQ